MNTDQKQELFNYLENLRELAVKLPHEPSKQTVEDIPDWAERTGREIQTNVLAIFELVQEGVA